MYRLLLITAFSFLSGCASVTGTPNQSVSVQTRSSNGKEIKEGACDLINKRGTWFITTPGTVQIHRSNDDLQVTCRKEGFITAEYLTYQIPKVQCLAIFY